MLKLAKRLLVVLGCFCLVLECVGDSYAVPLPQLFWTASVENEYLQVLVDETGQFIINTTGGDPNTRDDNDKRLVYGQFIGGWTSFSTIRVVQGGAATDSILYDTRLLEHSPEASGDEITTQWLLPGVRVQQVLSLADNPYTGRRDTVQIATTVTNISSTELSAGVRVMIDVMIGDNDFAPFFIPGTGNTNQEHEYTGSDIPSYWKAFEASDYGPTSLKGQGILTDPATFPDRFIVAYWPDLYRTAWDYSIIPGKATSDSAVAIYWQPHSLRPGESVTWATYYGLAGAGGGACWFDAPTSVTSLASDFEATLWVANRSEADFVGGTATIQLPAGLSLAPGETATKSMSHVPMNGGAQSVNWRLIASGATDADYRYSAAAEFASGSGPLSAEAAVHYQWLPTPSPVATPTPSATPSVTPTPTPVATATPTSTPTPTATLAPMPTSTTTPTPTPLPVVLLPLLPDTRWLWWPWLLLLILLLLSLLLLLLRGPRTRATVQAPVVRRVASPTSAGGLLEKPREAGPSVTHGRAKPELRQQAGSPGDRRKQ